jgi:two-component system chemotaxis sensor kinase CheA
MTLGSNDIIFQEFLSECDEIIQRVSQILEKIERSSFEPADIDSLYRDIHTLKGSAQLFGFNHLGLLAHALEATLEPVRKSKISIKSEHLNLLFSAFNIIHRVLGNPSLKSVGDKEIEPENKLIIPKLVNYSLEEFQANLNVINSFLFSSSEEKKTESISLNQSSQKQLPSNETSITENLKPNKEMNLPKNRKTSVVEETHNESSSIRVQVSILDKLMNLAGEMVLARNQVLQFAKKSEDTEFISLTQKLDLVTSELQDSVMRTRMQPMVSIFSKFHKLTKDLARDLNKEIELSITGAETEIDKSLLEAIKDPLNHLIRNACDHGIENPDERRKLKKRVQGTISLQAYHEGGHVIIEVSDDGRGLNHEKILSKAIEKKIISEKQSKELSIKEIQELIFAPGFSTAEKISSVSGRGVGMDVVKTNIEKVGGLIELISIVGEGTTMRLRIPLTLAIVPAMIVRAGTSFFAVPQVKLQELLRIDQTESGNKIEFLQDQMIYRLRGELLPVEFLSRLIGEKDINKQDVYNIVVLKNENQSYGLIVDEICDTADIVVKPLPAFLKKISYYSGATIMGDGSVSLILDIQGIATQAHLTHSMNESDYKKKIVEDKNIKETTDFLLFNLGESSHFALPLTLVHRLEEFSLDKIEASGNDKVIQYRGSLLPLVNLNEVLDVRSINPTKLSIVVVSKRNRLFGFVVDEIVDVLNSELEIIPPLKERPAIIGSLVTPAKKVITIINALSIIDNLLGLDQENYSDIKFNSNRVLLVEDTKFFAKQVIQLLNKAGLEVIHANDGLEALSILKNSSSNYFDLILSDIEMPKMNGYEFAKNLRSDKKFANLPLIALTTRYKDSDIQYGKEVGFNYYLEKLKNDELIFTIKNVLEGAV